MVRGEIPVDPALRHILERDNQPVIAPGGKKVPVASLFPTAEQGALMKDFAKTTEAEPFTPPFYDQEKVLGLYFTASWCPPCTKFTPQLKRIHGAVREKGKDFDVLVCSWDEDKSQYEDYTAEMPFHKLPFGDARIGDLSRAYGVSSIPTLVTVRARDNRVINRNAKDFAARDVDGRTYPWPPMQRSTLFNVLGVSTLGVAGVLAWVALRDMRFMRPKV
jgi:thiol-disulfide isomerase/thioredoxin